jgi:hypothetical protein
MTLHGSSLQDLSQTVTPAESPRRSSHEPELAWARRPGGHTGRGVTMVTETTLSTPLTSAPDAALMFPTLSSAQIARIASRGLIRPTTRGEVLVEAGQTDVPSFGRLVWATSWSPLHRPGQFTGEVSMIRGPALMRLRPRVGRSYSADPRPNARPHSDQRRNRRSADDRVDLSTEGAGRAGGWRRDAKGHPFKNSHRAAT